MDINANKTYAEHGESVFTTITRLAQEHDAVNLGQGFPNLYPPGELVDRFPTDPSAPLDHQYAPSPGLPELRSRLAEVYQDLYGFKPDPDTEITVTTGATEGLNAALFGLLNPGDRVVTIEPTYDLYRPVAQRAGADVTTVPLESSSGFSLPLEPLLESLDSSVDLFVFNNPHNPTGRSFSRTKIQQIANHCRNQGIPILADEVYEHLVLEGSHHPLWSTEAGRECTIFTGSTGKAFNATGWKLGWLVGPAHLTQPLRRSHQFTTFSTATPLQRALEEFLASEPVIEWWSEEFRPRYRERKRLLLEGLQDSPLEPLSAEGTYFQPARAPSTWKSTYEDDYSLARHLIKEHGLATIPMSSFYTDNPPGDRYLRFAFCKTDEELDRAVKRLNGLPE